ncbi:MAG: substrate-binding domain-containing protein [Syntrophales bacterium]|nr:substrate-binding domain-containing protein [Syntrophales bacterium]
MASRIQILIMTALALVFFTGTPAQSQSGVLMMATTTSTDNTGLLEYLAPPFKEQTGIELRWVATGTGKAIALGRNCDVDIVFTHDPGMEEDFVGDGYGVERVLVMYNDFVIVGPESDPGDIKGMTAAGAMETMSAKGLPFASRGDKSGTHLAELGIWKKSSAAVPEKEPWYIQTGQGMINTLIVASERQAYCLTDRGTYITFEARYEDTPPLVILVEGDEVLRNQYAVMAVNPEKCGNAKIDLAQTFVDWIVSPETQELIGEFTLLGKMLFYPNADN